MSAPPPIVLAKVILIGWPLVQLVSVLIARPYRLEMKGIVSGLRADPALTASDVASVDELLQDAKGSVRRKFAVLRLPVTLAWVNLASLLPRSAPRREPHPAAELPPFTVEAPDRAHELSRARALADKVAIIRSPFSLFCGAALATPFLFVCGCLLAVRALLRRSD